MIIFIVGCFLFLLLAILILYWMLSREYERNFYKVVFSFYLIAILQGFFLTHGVEILGERLYLTIFTATPMLLIIFIVLYVMIYVFHTINTHKVKLLCLLPVIIVEVLLLVFVSLSNYNRMMYDIITISTVVLSIVITYVQVFNNRRNLIRYMGPYSFHYINNTEIPREVYYKYSMREMKYYNELSEVVFQLYHMVKIHQISLVDVKEYLNHEAKIPEALKIRVMERFSESYNISMMKHLGILDFANLLFPEFYSSVDKAFSSEKYESRRYEDYYFLIRKNISLNNQQYEKISEKLDRILNTDIVNQGERNFTSNKIDVSDTSEYAQSIVREINHCVKTPLLAIKYATRNLLSNKEQISEIQKEKLETINGNISIIESIINGYRKLVIFSDDIIPDKIISHISTAVKTLNQQNNKNVRLNIKEFIEPCITYGNNIITILLLPLIHNAYEASPDNETVIVCCNEKNNQYIISVENICTMKVSVGDLNNDGYTTKEKGGEGLRSVRRIAAVLNFEFSISTHDNGRRVVAILKIPKNREGEMNE